MRKCGCFMAPPAGLKTLKRRPSGLFVRPKQTTQPIHCLKTAVTRCLKIFMMCAPAPSQKLALKKRPDQHL